MPTVAAWQPRNFTYPPCHATALNEVVDTGAEWPPLPAFLTLGYGVGLQTGGIGSIITRLPQPANRISYTLGRRWQSK